MTRETSMLETAEDTCGVRFGVRVMVRVMVRVRVRVMVRVRVRDRGKVYAPEGSTATFRVWRSWIARLHSSC